MYNSRMSFGLRKRYWPPAPVTGDPPGAQVQPRWGAVLMAAGSHRLRVPSASGRGPILEVSAFTNILDSHEESPAISAFTNAQAPQGLIPRNLNFYQCHRGGGRTAEISALITVYRLESGCDPSKSQLLSLFYRRNPEPGRAAPKFSAFTIVLPSPSQKGAQQASQLLSMFYATRNPETRSRSGSRLSVNPGQPIKTAPAPESGSLQLATFNHPTNLQPTGALCLPPDIT